MSPVKEEAQEAADAAEGSPTPTLSPEWATVKRELGVRDRLEWNTRPEADWARSGTGRQTTSASAGAEVRSRTRRMTRS